MSVSVCVTFSAVSMPVYASIFRACAPTHARTHKHTHSLTRTNTLTRTHTLTRTACTLAHRLTTNDRFITFENNLVNDKFTKTPMLLALRQRARHGFSF
jgi:hypothetical protein